MTTVGGGQIPGIVRHFEELEDPRSTVNRLHLLEDVIVISILAVIAGADVPLAIARWAATKEEWLTGHLQLPNGIARYGTPKRSIGLMTTVEHCIADALQLSVAQVQKLRKGISAYRKGNRRRMSWL